MKKQSFIKISLIVYVAVSIIQILLFFLIKYKTFTAYWMIFTVFFVLSLPFDMILSLLKVQQKTRSNFQVLFYSLLFSTILVEIILRVSGYMLTPLEKLPWADGKYHSMFDAPKSALNVYGANQEHHFKSPEFNYIFKTNSDGLSDIEHNVEKPQNEYRIAGLGDSFTEGIGTHQDSTWLKYLETYLKKESKNKNVITLNGGIGGSDPFYEYVILEKLLLKYKPDLTLLAINMTDIGDVILRGGFERFQKDGSVKFRSGPQWEWMYEYSHIIRFVVNKILNYDLQFQSPKQQIIAEETAIIKLLKCIDTYKKLAQEKHFELLIVLHPWLWEWQSEKSKFINRFKDYCFNNNLQCLDLMEYYINIEKIKGENAQEYYWKQDCHNNSKGYEIFARGVEWKLKEIGVLDSLR